MGIKKTTEQFIKEAIAIHGVDRYGYSRVKYKRNDLKVKIWCNKHQVFFYQTPKEHLRG